MRTFLLTLFWFTNFGSALQLLVITFASWAVFSGNYSFTELNVDIFVTQIVPWFQWVETLILELFGEFGRWILTIPVLVISPIKLVVGTAIGLWAYRTAQEMPITPAYA